MKKLPRPRCTNPSFQAFRTKADWCFRLTRPGLSPLGPRGWLWRLRGLASQTWTGSWRSVSFDLVRFINHLLGLSWGRPSLQGTRSWPRLSTPRRGPWGRLANSEPLIDPVHNDCCSKLKHLGSGSHCWTFREINSCKGSGVSIWGRTRWGAFVDLLLHSLSQTFNSL